MHSQLNSFSREVSKHYDSYFKDFGLATSYIELLLLIYKEGGLSQKYLSDRMNLAPSTITRFIKKLEKSGYIEKNKDGRLTKIVISAEASERVEKMHNLYEKAGRDLKERLGEKYVSTTSRLLKHGVNQMAEES